jgi:hypothetical protein
MGLYEFMFGGDEASEETETMFGFTAEGAAQEAEKLAVDIPEITWKDVGNVALDFTPIIGDIKGGYETVQMIGEELSKENPNYYLIGAMGGLGAAATIIGLVPGAGDAAQKAIMQGTKMMAERSGQLAGELTGTARAIRDGDLEFIRGRGNPENSQGVGADVVRKDPSKAKMEELDPIRQNSSKGFYKTKAPNYVEDIEVDVEDQGLLVPEKSLSIDDLENTDLIPLIADRTAAGKTLKGVQGGAKDYKFENPVDLQGGRGFMRYPDTGAFASMPNVMGEQAQLAKRVAEGGGDPRLVHMSMSAEGGDFSTMMSDTVMEMMDQSDISAKDVKAFDSWVKANVDADFPGIRSANAKDYLATQVPGTRRQLMWKKLDGPEFKNKGFPVMGDARVAITDPRLLSSPSMQGSSVTKVDTSGNLITGPVRQHKTYSSQVGPTGADGYVGELDAVPYEILMRDFFEQRRAAGTKAGSDQRSLQMNSTFSQPVDAQMVEEVNRYLEIQDLAERDAYKNSLPEQRAADPKTYSIGKQMDNALPLEIGINPAASDGALLKSYTSEDLQMLDQLAEGATAGTRKADALINFPVEPGTKVGIRLNLNSNIPDALPGMNKLQTLHKNNYNGPALSYQTTATVENVKFNVSQSGRAGIAAKKYAPNTPEAKSKFPAMSVDGNYVADRNILNEMDNTVVEIGTNPMNLHLFIDMATGQAVESAEIATVIGDRAYAKGVKYMKKADAPAPKKASDGTELPSEVRYKMNKGGLVTALH